MNQPTFEHLVDQCLFCDPERHGQGGQILLRSDTFYLFAGLGAILDGYVIVAPYRCDDAESRLRALSDMSPAMADELTFLRALIADFYRDRFGTPGLSFEHGRAGTCAVGRDGTKHCYHGHLCCYPSRELLVDEQQLQALPSQPLVYYHDLPQAAGDSPYLLVESFAVNQGIPYPGAGHETRKLTMFRLRGESELESQFLRRVLARRVGNPERWDWRAEPRVDSAHRLVRDFGEWLSIQQRLQVRVERGAPPRLDLLGSYKRSTAAGNDRAARPFYEKWGKHKQTGAIGRFLGCFPGEERDGPLRLLDAGCGPGQYARAFFHLGAECVAIDDSPDMLAIARQAAAAELAESPARLRFEQACAFDLPLPPGSFDGIWYSAVFVHAPRTIAVEILRRLRALLRKDGVLYLSVQVRADDSLPGCDVRLDGRCFFYYGTEEFESAVATAGLQVRQRWGAQVMGGTYDRSNLKYWRHYILHAAREPASRPATADDGAQLGTIGERGILEHLRSRLTYTTEDVVLSIGDDCAALRSRDGEVTVVTTDPCPLPVIAMLGNNDLWCWGWFSMAINLSDLGAMGARPLGMLLAIEAPEQMPLRDLDAFYDGVDAAAAEFQCPVIGGNLKDAPAFRCVGTGLGAVAPEAMLRRDAAEPGDKVLVLGRMGRFWAGVVHRLEGIPLSASVRDELLDYMRKPWPRLREGRMLSQQGLVRCGMDSSDGLIACFYELARASVSGVDLHLDLRSVEVDPLVEEIASASGIDPRKLMLSWGDWQLVTTARPERVATIRAQMATLHCPVHDVGWVGGGEGRVWLHEDSGTASLHYLASERFTGTSYFSHGLDRYLEELRRSPLVDRDASRSGRDA